MTADVFGDAPEIADGEIDPLSPEHVVTLVRFLASPAASDVNGQVFIVYGPQVDAGVGAQRRASVRHRTRRRGIPAKLSDDAAGLLCWTRPKTQLRGDRINGVIVRVTRHR